MQRLRSETDYFSNIHCNLNHEWIIMTFDWIHFLLREIVHYYYIVVIQLKNKFISGLRYNTVWWKLLILNDINTSFVNIRLVIVLLKPSFVF